MQVELGFLFEESGNHGLFDTLNFLGGTIVSNSPFTFSRLSFLVRSQREQPSFPARLGVLSQSPAPGDPQVRARATTRAEDFLAHLEFYFSFQTA